MKWMIVTIVLAMGFVAGPVSAEDYGGPISFVAHWNLLEPDVTPFTTVDVAAYEAGEMVVVDLIRMTDFYCNTKFKITATKGPWTLPANYHSGDGAKKADGSDSDLLLMVDNVVSGYASNPSEGLASLGSYSSYAPIATDGSSGIIGGGAIGESPHGVTNASCDINAKILMDWATDIVGGYSMTLTLSIGEVTE